MNIFFIKKIEIKKETSVSKLVLIRFTVQQKELKPYDELF